jgi:hypothetical protein
VEVLLGRCGKLEQDLTGPLYLFRSDSVCGVESYKVRKVETGPESQQTLVDDEFLTASACVCQMHETAMFMRHPRRLQEQPSRDKGDANKA